MLPLINACFWQMESTFSGPHAWMVIIKWSQQQHRKNPSREPWKRNMRRAATMIRSIPRFLLHFVVPTPSLMREQSNLASTASLQVISHKLQYAASTRGCLEFIESAECIVLLELPIFYFCVWAGAQIGQIFRQHNWTAVRMIITLVGMNRDSVYFNKNPAMTLANLNGASVTQVFVIFQTFQLRWFPFVSDSHRLIFAEVCLKLTSLIF